MSDVTTLIYYSWVSPLIGFRCVIHRPPGISRKSGRMGKEFGGWSEQRMKRKEETEDELHTNMEVDRMCTMHDLLLATAAGIRLIGL
jgi:hypothetical protein